MTHSKTEKELGNSTKSAIDQITATDRSHRERSREPSKYEERNYYPTGSYLVPLQKQEAGFQRTSNMEPMVNNFVMQEKQPNYELENRLNQLEKVLDYQQHNMMQVGRRSLLENNDDFKGTERSLLIDGINTQSI